MWTGKRFLGQCGLSRIHIVEVTEEDLQEWIDCYRDKYGVCTEVDNYTVFFIPNLAVMEKV